MERLLLRPPLLYGETPLHRELESAIAELVGTESAIVFAGGHATNVGTVSHLMGAEDLIIHDEWSHDSCVRGALLSGATRRPTVTMIWSRSMGCSPSFEDRIAVHSYAPRVRTARMGTFRTCPALRLLADKARCPSHG